MDIEEVGGQPRIPDILHYPITADEPEPVEEKSRLLQIHERTSPYENPWLIKDRVTISAEARRKYKQMRSARNNKYLDH